MPIGLRGTNKEATDALTPGGDAQAMIASMPRWMIGGLLAGLFMFPSCGGDSASAPVPPADPLRAAQESGDVMRAPTALGRACDQIRRRVDVMVRCPRVLPANGGGYERPRTYDVTRCTYLVNLEPRGASRRPGTPFHVLFGSRCEPFDLSVRTDRWPARREPDDDLRLVGMQMLEPGEDFADAKPTRLAVLGETTVVGQPALVLRPAPYPEGGIHGGHLALVWNSASAGHTITMHLAGTDEPKASPKAVQTLRAVAMSMTGPATGAGLKEP